MRDAAKRKMERKLHLILPTAIVLCPTGCRNSLEAEASWRLGAAAVAVRVLRPQGVLPVFKDTEDVRETPRTRELHVPLLSADLELLTEVSKEEGGSRGSLARKLLLATQRIIDECPGVLNHAGLVSELLKRFSPPS